MIECQICGHLGIHAILVDAAALPTRGDQCSRWVAESAGK